MCRPKFMATITETLKRTVEVAATDQHEAEQMVSDGWHNSKYILDADNFVAVEFEAVMSRDNSPVRAYPNGTVKKRSIRVDFQVLARSRFETDPNGTFMQICFLTVCK